MRRLLPASKLVVASHNKGKAWEINELLKPYGLNAVSAAELDLPEPEETELTFEGNARLKAVAAAKASQLPALADDSGLEVEALGGAPGIYSARWAGPDKDFGLAMKRVADELTARNAWPAPGLYGLGPRANFISVLCLAWPDGTTQTFEGKVFGQLVWPPRGGNGFGYDPMFVPDDDTRTYGEMPPAEKYAGSHRTRAFQAFKRDCLDHIAPTHATKAGGRDLAALTAAAANLSTREELARFVDGLQADVEQNGADWPVRDLKAYLAALAAHLRDDTLSETEPRWRTLAKALLGASMRK